MRNKKLFKNDMFTGFVNEEIEKENAKFYKSNKIDEILVSFSGGKDSTASLIWAVNNFDRQKITAIYCDTNWENQITYDYIKYVTDILKVKLITVKSNEYKGFEDYVLKNNFFPTGLTRSCTTNLKIYPMIDYIISNPCNRIVILGIRADESKERKNENMSCDYFKKYRTDFGDVYKPNIVNEYINKRYLTESFKPLFEWSANEVLDYIKANGLEINRMYYQGFKRVGCFPCINIGIDELKNLLLFYPERFDVIAKLEHQTGKTFFKSDRIPKKFRKDKFPTIEEVKLYLNSKDYHKQPQIKYSNDIKIKTPVCISSYNLCE